MRPMPRVIRSAAGCGGRGRLSEPLATQLFDAAAEAFTQGFQVVALTSGLIAAAAAISTAIFLRDVGASSEPESPPLGGAAESAAVADLEP